MLQLKIEHCPHDDVEELSDILESTDALSVTLTDKQDDPILEPELGTTPLWPNVIIHALFAEEQEAQSAIEVLTKDHPNLSYSFEELPEQDWQRASMDDFKPQPFGARLWICPSWLTPPVPEAVNLILDPGLAFGTGTHPTTFLCLTWLEQANLHNKTVIDYGCGSGVLALAALKLGVRHVTAVDIDEQALIATQNNATNNQIPSTDLTIGFPEALRTPADLIIANILLTPLMQLRERFEQLLNNHGTLVVSGIMENQAEELIASYSERFTHQHSETHDGWALLVFKHNLINLDK